MARLRTSVVAVAVVAAVAAVAAALGLGAATAQPSPGPATRPDAAAAPATAEVLAGTLVVGSARDGDHELYRRPAAGGRLVRLTRNTTIDTAPAWSPDGRLIAFVSDRRGSEDLWVMRGDGTRARRLTRTRRAAEHSPAWAPDGRSLAFASDRSGQFEVYVMRSDGTRVRRLTRSAGFDVQPAFSPDGRVIAFASTRAGGQFDVHVMRSDGTRVRRLTRTRGTVALPESDMAPSWSPDGRLIAFGANRGGPIDDLWVMDADGGDQRRVTRTDFVDELTPRFSPDGRRLLFTTSAHGRGPRIETSLLDGSQRTVLVDGVWADWNAREG